MNRSLVILFLSFSLAACAHRVMTPDATATLESRSGSNASGIVKLARMSDGSVKVRVEVSGVAPGVHGFHIHEKGDCSAPDAMSAGPHFNPASAAHGGPADAAHHAGDLGNVAADANGEMNAEFTTRSISLDGPSSAIGKAFVLHADPDDLKSQPAGNAGKRIACGVVVRSP